VNEAYNITAKEATVITREN